MKALKRPGLLLAAGLLGTACLYTYKLAVPELHTYRAAGITEVSATTLNGAISVGASHDTVITVNVIKHSYGRDSTDAAKGIAYVVYGETIVGRQLSLTAEMPSGSRPYGADFTITVPESTGLLLATSNGSISVANTFGDLSAGTTNGSVELAGTAGRASASTTNGALTVKVHSGTVLGATTNAAIDCDLAALGPADTVRLGTTNGKVTLLLPDGVSAVIDATNSSGTITIYDFTVVYQTQTDHQLKGVIGSGASPITIVTTNGDVVVRRR